MGEYDSAIALVTRKLAQKGQSVTVRSYAAGTLADSTKPWNAAATTPSDQTAKALFLEYDLKYIDGEQIVVGDQEVYLPPVDTLGAALVAEVEGLVIRGADKYKIIRVGKLDPNGELIYYRLQVRK